ncbi:MAG: DUF2760 domain-containing protein [Caldilineaceae bacterium]|nr:DUF2760 domain-containing protein [Caldilineaceae bacterium]
MNAKQNFTTQAIVVTLILNVVLLGAFYLLAGDTLQASGQLLSLLVIGLVLTVILAGVIAFLGGRAIDAAVAAVPPAPAAPLPAPLPARPAPKAEPTPAPKVAPAPPQPAPTASALQLLAILQREGRLIDFLQEDLSLYEDEQIGAAVRSIHAGCKQGLAAHVTLEPVMTDEEGSTITVPAGFDAHAIRLTGTVAGEPPFKGIVRHRGWRAVKVDLPQLTANASTQAVVAAAEVEIEG